MPRLRRVDCSAPGIRRRRRGKGFEYLHEDGSPVSAEERARIRALVIPPAWRDVWICTHPAGHLQATGTDAAGRKQYLYHELWRRGRDRQKFEQMLDFARCLPDIRDTCEAALAGDGWGRERVLALAVRLLYRGFFRIGSESYAEENQTYGLATIQKRHVMVKDDVITFDYISKGGKRRSFSLPDPLAAPVVAALRRRRGGGSELLAYKHGGRWVDVKSPDINTYLKELTSCDISAKDFRTWSGTVLAAIAMAVSGELAPSVTGRKRAIARAVKEVALRLDNTPAVCRASYIDPRVFDRYRSGWTISLDALEGDADWEDLFADQPLIDAVVDLLEDRRSSDGLEQIA
jgi:DNA topoisomerase-1